MEKTTTFNHAQYEVINAMSCISSEEDLKILKDLLVHFLNSRLQNELNRLWDEGSLSQERIDAMSKEHLRTPYK